MEWPARSCDLTPLDYWLWSYLKNKIYLMKNPPQTIDQLEQAISDQINLIRFNIPLLIKVINDMKRRADLCIKHNGNVVAHL